MSEQLHEIQRSSTDDALFFLQCYALDDLHSCHIDKVPAYCPDCGKVLRQSDVAVKAPEPEVVDVPLVTNDYGCLVTGDNIILSGRAIGCGKPAPMLPGYCAPPVTFVRFLWPAQPDYATWPPDDNEYRVWQDMNTGNWSYNYVEGRDVVYAEAARFHVQREVDNDRT